MHFITTDTNNTIYVQIPNVSKGAKPRQLLAHTVAESAVYALFCVGRAADFSVMSKNVTV